MAAGQKTSRSTSWPWRELLEKYWSNWPKSGLPGQEIAAGGEGAGRDVVQITRDELRVIEDIVELRADLDVHPLVHADALQQGCVEVVDAAQGEGVAAAVGVSAGPRLDVARVGVRGDV